MKWSLFQDGPYAFAPSERASVPGSPAAPDLSPPRRGVFFVVACLLCLTCNLINGLVQVNASGLMGALGVDSSEIAWLPTVYSMTFIGMNLLLVRFRQQFGIRAFTMIGLAGCSAVTALHLLVHGLTGALVVHAAAGVAAAPLSSLAVYYMMQAMPKGRAMAGAVLAFGLQQVATPFARLVSTSLVDYDQWRSLYLFEFGLTAVCLGCVGLFRLPPNQRADHLRPLDFVTFSLMTSGAALLCAVLGMGTVLWWLDRAWLGWALAAALPFIGAALLVESRRDHPLLDLKWLTGPILLRFAAATVLSRIVLGEQSSATGLLGVLGVGNDELHAFSAVLVISTVAGAVVAALLYQPSRGIEMCAAAIALVAAAAFHDAQATSLVRAPQLLVSQGLIAFANALFIGPAAVYGMGQVLRAGGGPLASFIVMFTAVQNLGGLGGTALMQTFQVLREKASSAQLTATISAVQASTADRIAAEGVGALQAASTQQANVLAYNNVFLLTAVLATATALYFAGLAVLRWRKMLLAGVSQRAASAP